MRTITSLLIMTFMILSAFTAGAQPPPRGPVISPDNAAQLKLIATLGRGEVRKLLWTPDDKQLIVVSTNALSIYTMGDWDHPHVMTIETPLIDAALAPDGASLALLLPGQIQILDTDNWTETLRIETPTNAYGETLPTIAHTGDYVIHWDAASYVLLVHDSHTGEEVSRIASPGMVSAFVNGSAPLFVATAYLNDFQYGFLPADFMVPEENEYGGVRFIDHTELAIEPIEYVRDVDYRSDQQIITMVGTKKGGEAHNIPDVAGCTSQKWQGRKTPAAQGHLILIDATSASQVMDVTLEALDGVALSPTGTEIAVGQCIEWGNDLCLYFQITLLDYSGNETARLPGQLPGSVGALRYSSTGRYVAASNHTAVWVWDAESQEQIALLHGFSTGDPTLLFNDAHLVVGASSTYRSPGVTIWDLRTLESVAYLPCAGAIALHDTQLVCGNELWQIDTIPPRITQHIPGIDSDANAAFSSDGALIAFADRLQQTLVLWDVNEQTVVASVTGLQAEHIEFSHDDRTLFALSRNFPLLGWDVAALRATQIVTLPELDNDAACLDHLNTLPTVTVLPVGNVTAFALHPNDPQSVLVHGYEGVIQKIDIHTGKEKLAIDYWTNVTFSDAYFVYSPDASLIVGSRCSASPVGGFCTQSDMQVFDANTGESLFTHQRDYDQINRVAFTPDGRWLLTGHTALYGMRYSPLPDANIHIWGIGTP